MSKKQKYIISLVVIIILATLSVYGLKVNPPGQGLDLKGGLSIVLKAKGTSKEVRKGMPQALLIVRERVDKLGVAEPSIEQQGPDGINIQLPGIKNAKEALKIIPQTALLEFAIVEKEFENQSTDQLNKAKKEGKKVLGPTLLTGKSVKQAAPTYSPDDSKPIISFEFDDEGATKFADITTKNTKKRLAIVLDGKIITDPNIQEPITGGKGIISGDFTIEEARRIALVLQTGNLPFKMEFSKTQTVGPTLGRDSLRAGLIAGIVGFALVIIFMLGFYRVFGLITLLSTVFFALLLGGSLVLLNIILGQFGNAGISLSLPSIAGFILMVGVAADSSIIVFERIKEEIRSGVNLRTALDTGYEHGFQTFLDADLVSFVTAIVLFYVGIGPIKGFAVTLVLGIICDLATSLLFTRSILGLMANYNLVKSPALIGLKITEESKTSPKGKALAGPKGA